MKYYEVDIRDTENCIETMGKDGSFDFIFIANCLTETPEPDVQNIVWRLPEILRDDGAIIIAEAQRNYTKALLKALATDTHAFGLNMY